MQSRNGDPSGDQPWTRVHHWHHPVFSAPQWVPGTWRLWGRWRAPSALGPSPVLFPVSLTSPSQCSHILVRIKMTSPSPPWPVSSTGSLWNPEESECELFWSGFILGALALSAVKRNPAPPIFNTGSWEHSAFLLGDTSSRDKWDTLRWRSNECVLYTCLHLCLCWYFLFSLYYQPSQEIWIFPKKAVGSGLCCRVPLWRWI